MFDLKRQTTGKKLWLHLQKCPEKYDVTFVVGPERKIVKALKIVLESSSPVFESEFKENWRTAVTRTRTIDIDGIQIDNDKEKETGGIPLPDFDPVAFQIFITLLFLGTWETKFLKKLELPYDGLLNLLFISQRFEMRELADNLNTLALLAKRRQRDIKTNYYDSHRLSESLRGLIFPFKTLNLAKFYSIQPWPFQYDKNACNCLFYPAVSLVRKIWWNENYFQVNKKIILRGLGFLGPIDAGTDSYLSYDVKVQIRASSSPSQLSGVIKKQVLARKDEFFRFFFDEPIAILPGFDAIDGYGRQRRHYTISYALEGPETKSIGPNSCKSHIKEDSYMVFDDVGHGFKFHRRSGQLVEILYEDVNDDD